MTKSPHSEELLFNQAVVLPAGKRRAFLVRACGRDITLRRRCEALLRANTAAGNLLDAGPGGAVRSALSRPPPAEIPGAIDQTTHA